MDQSPTSCAGGRRLIGPASQPGPVSWARPCPSRPRHTLMIDIEDGLGTIETLHLCDGHWAHLKDLGLH